MNSKALVLVAAVLAIVAGSLTASDYEPYHPRHLIVRFKNDDPKHVQKIRQALAPGNCERLFAERGTASLRHAFSAPVYLLTYASEEERLVAESILGRDTAIAYVERDYRAELFSDPLFEQQWGLRNVGQDYLGIERLAGYNNDTLAIKQGTTGADMNRPAWPSPLTGHHKVKLAITDTGVDYKHPDLAAHIWTNPGEVPDNGLDDDFNGLIDDIHGFDFSGNEITNFDIVGDPDPMDTIGHGSHVSGIAAAVSGNGIGIEGVADNVEIMCVKIFPNAFASVISRAVVYAVENGAEVINASWGTPYYSSLIKEVVDFADESGVLFVAASGNSGDNSLFYPGAFDRIITVGASNSDDRVTYFSTYGPSVDLVAPGRDILSLRAFNTDLYAAGGEHLVRIIEDDYYLADGTSMAAPHVAGAAAFLLSVAPGLTLDSLKVLLVNTTDEYEDPFGDGRYFPGRDIYSGYGRLNLGRAVNLLSGEYVEIESPVFNAIASDVIDFTGSAFSQSEREFLLEIKPASESEWIAVASGSSDLVRSHLADWDSSPYDGLTQVRLSLDDDLIFATRIRLVNNVRVELVSPAAGDTVNSAADIVGSASLPGFNGWELAYYSDLAPGQKNLIATSTELIFRDLLAEWKTGPIRPGSGQLVLTARSSFGDHSTSVPIVISSILAEGYPARPSARPGLNPAVGNLDNDPYPEIVSGTADNIFIDHFDQGILETLQPDFGTSYASAVALYDVNDDAIDEIVAVTDSGVAVLSSNGEMLPGWPKHIPTGNLYTEMPTPLITDIDGDHEMEILVINQAGDIYCWRWYGESYFRTQQGIFTHLDDSGLFRIFGGSFVPYLFAYDFNEDGWQDVGALFSTRGSMGGIYMFSGRNGQPLYPDLGKQVKAVDNFFGGLLADFDNDGVPEIAFTHWYGGNDFLMGVSVCESDGSLLPGWPHYFPDKSQWFSAYPAAADLDGDSLPELITVFSAVDGAEVYVWHGDGRPLLESDLGLNNGLLAAVPTSLSSPIVVDVDNDGEVEILSRGGALFWGKYERLFAWHLDGTQVRGWPVYTYADPATVTFAPFTPVAGDFDLDDKLELLMNSSDMQVYVWRLPTQATTSAVQWGGFLRDSRRTGIYPFRPRRHTAVEPFVPLPEAYSLEQNYPNPFNGVTAIEIELQHSGNVTLEVFNILGQRVAILAETYLSAGRFRYSWDGSDDSGNEMGSGLYLYRLRVGDFSETRKMIYLK